jgi:hypothetical protein
MMNSPFKFPDSYTHEDRNIFFGSDQEVFIGEWEMGRIGEGEI